MTELSRRSLLAGSGALLMLAGTPGSAAATTTGVATSAAPVRATGAARASAISQGTTLFHADLHNHTLMSDGDGDPAKAYESMRSAGLDVAALTDHATLWSINGLSQSEWTRTGQLADAADDPGVYTALRGFEWSHPLLGHVNVWYTGAFTDLGGSPGMARLYDWISRTGGISGFNHPGREILRFNDFSYNAALREQMVGLEMFNRGDDYLFDGWSSGQSSPLNACLNAGWRTGLTGVTDEHGTEWGYPEGKGRTGVWAVENTRNGVLAAMRERRFFATRVSGLRVDATASGVRMGGSLPFTKGDVRFVVDLDRGPEWVGKPLHLQVLRPGTRAPEVADVVETEAGRVTEFTVPLDAADGGWVVLRISDPSQANGSPGPSGHPCNDWGVAYTSPWWLTM
ncbi:CehA/McbA family metallohydrolase [Actinoplanes flavus]|uniref:PHP domain-containing protein n=1 Tax=Actinoplanes flavus TaxID=2820290 RepID=A0ABS3V008_9ACTN|nr:CehA/McbA family metallohydrolase [Actinoplanes flavus]MBO3744173.1 PHP domain-containing protein [Actinoplanes flavus]